MEKKIDLIVMTDGEPGENAYTTAVTEEEARMLEAISEPMDEEMKAEALREILTENPTPETEE